MLRSLCCMRALDTEKFHSGITSIRRRLLLCSLYCIALQRWDSIPCNVVTMARLPKVWSLCSRYDYEGVESDAANNMIEHLLKVQADSKPGDKFGDYELQTADEFSYTGTCCRQQPFY